MLVCVWRRVSPHARVRAKKDALTEKTRPLGRAGTCSPPSPPSEEMVQNVDSRFRMSFSICRKQQIFFLRRHARPYCSYKGSGVAFASCGSRKNGKNLLLSSNPSVCFSALLEYIDRIVDLAGNQQLRLRSKKNSELSSRVHLLQGF